MKPPASRRGETSHGELFQGGIDDSVRGELGSGDADGWAVQRLALAQSVEVGNQGPRVVFVDDTTEAGREG
jgi:hypothetical protein